MFGFVFGIMYSINSILGKDMIMLYRCLKSDSFKTMQPVDCSFLSIHSLSFILSDDP